MQLLTAVNLILPKLGEHPVTSLKVPHPTLAVLLPELEVELRTVLMRGWWFNEFKYTATPDGAGLITLGVDTLSFVPVVGEPIAALRGQELFDPETMSFVWTKPIKGIVTQYVDFELLPESAAHYVLYSATLNVLTTDLGGGTADLQVWGGKAQEAWQSMLAEHLRQRKYSTKNSKRWQRLRNAMRA